LKYLFKGRSRWIIKKIGEEEFILHFPFEELRNQLTKFKGFEFATLAIKSKVEATDLDKGAVSVLEKASHFPNNVRMYEVIKEISYLVGGGGPIEVDENSIKTGDVIRVRVICKDATKIEGSTLVHINGQGYMIKWWSEKSEKIKTKPTQQSKGSKFYRHKMTWML
jgi:hypothetical protein